MDYATRIAVRRQIDSISRKRLGLGRPCAARVSAPQRPNPRGHWSDIEIQVALKRIADHEGCTVRELRLAAYRRFQNSNRSLAPSINTIKTRLAEGVPNCPRRLQ